MNSYTVPTMVTIKECAERTNLSAYYIRHLCWENKIVFIRTGKKYLINFEKFCDFLNNQS